MAATRITNGSAVAYFTTDAAGGTVKIAQNMLDQQTPGNIAGPFSVNSPTLRFHCACLGVDLRFDQQTINDLLPGLTAFANTGVLS